MLKRFNMAFLKGFFNSSINLTLPFYKAVEIKGIENFKQRHCLTSLSNRLTTTFEVNIHALTHFDLPDTYSDLAWERAQQQAITKPEIIKPSSVISDFSAPLIFRSVIVDFSHKRDIIKQALQNENRRKLNEKFFHFNNPAGSVFNDAIEPQEFINVNTSLNDYMKIISDLRIRKNDIVDPLNKYLNLRVSEVYLREIPKNITLSEGVTYNKEHGTLSCKGVLTQEKRDRLLKLSPESSFRDAANSLFHKSNENFIVIFFTGWGDFLPAHRSLNNPVFEGWHPYLLNPYLDNEANDYLVNCSQVSGIAMDCLNLECPLKFVDTKTSLPFIQRAKEAYIKKPELYGVDINEQITYYHMRYLANKKYYIKHLYLSDESFYPYEGLFRGNFLDGTLLILPIVLTVVDNDAMPIQVFFKPEGNLPK